MKKLLAVILSVICIFSCFAVPACAAGNIIGELASDFFERITGEKIEEDTTLGYGVFYNMDSLSGVTVIYKPSPSIKFNNPGTYTITSDTPLSFDYDFVCWEDKEGKEYYPGDKVYVDGQLDLYAKWVERNDKDIKLARMIRVSLEALRRLIGKFFGFIDIVVEFNENYVPTQPDEPRYYDVSVNEIIFDREAEKIYVYINSKEFYDKGFVRMEEGRSCPVYLCSGFNEVTAEPIDKTDYICRFEFANHQAADKTDVLIIDATDIDFTSFEAKLNDGAEYYMVFSVNSSIYSSPAKEGKLYPEYTNPLSAVFTIK